MIKAVIFDYGGTLADTSVPWDIFSEIAVERLSLEGIDVDVVDFENAVQETNGWRTALHGIGKEADSYMFFNHALSILGHSACREVTDELEMYLYENYVYTWLADLEKLLLTLSEDYKIALLSNSWHETARQTLRDNGYGRWFDAMIVSYDIGIPKPDPRIFRHTLNLLKVDADEAVMVGDSIKADIEGALNAGLKAVWVDNMRTGEWNGYSVRSIDELPEVLKQIR